MSFRLQAGAIATPGAEPRAPDFRRRPFLPRRRRRSVLLALAKPLFFAVALVALPLSAAGWVLTSPRFALREVAVQGTARVPAEAVRAALAPFLGKNLVALPLPRVQAVLRRDPWIASLALEKDLPARLRVEVTERKPVALLLAGSGLSYADADGRPIVSLPPGEPAPDLLVVSLGDEGPAGLAGALTAAGELGRANPNWAARLTRVEALGEGDFRLHTAALPFPLLVRSGEVGAKARRLEALLPELGRRYRALAAVDLRLPRRIVVEPAANSGSSAAPKPGQVP